MGGDAGQLDEADSDAQVVLERPHQWKAADQCYQRFRDAPKTTNAAAWPITRPFRRAHVPTKTQRSE